MSSTQTHAGISRESLIGKITPACRNVNEAKSLGQWLHDNREAGEKRIKIPLVETNEGLKAIIVYPESDLTYGSRISCLGICHQLDDIAKEVGVNEIIFYSDRGNYGKSFLNVGVGDRVEVTSLRDTIDLPGSVVELL